MKMFESIVEISVADQFPGLIVSHDVKAPFSTYVSGVVLEIAYQDDGIVAESTDTLMRYSSGMMIGDDKANEHFVMVASHAVVGYAEFK